MKLISEVFGEKVISKGIWPPRSPDLTSSDLFFRGDAKAKVCGNNPHTLDKLKTAVIQFTQSVTRKDLVKVFSNKI
jgi:hypothetical protein